MISILLNHRPNDKNQIYHSSDVPNCRRHARLVAGDVSHRLVGNMIRNPEGMACHVARMTCSVTLDRGSAGLSGDLRHRLQTCRPVGTGKVLNGGAAMYAQTRVERSRILW